MNEPTWTERALTGRSRFGRGLVSGAVCLSLVGVVEGVHLWLVLGERLHAPLDGAAFAAVCLAAAFAVGCVVGLAEGLGLAAVGGAARVLARSGRSREQATVRARIAWEAWIAAVLVSGLVVFAYTGLADRVHGVVNFALAQVGLGTPLPAGRLPLAVELALLAAIVAAWVPLHRRFAAARLAAGEERRRWGVVPRIAAVAFVALGLAAHLANTRLYVNLYLDLHRQLTIVTFLSFHAAWCCLPPRWIERLGRAVTRPAGAGVLAAAFLASLAGAHVILEGRLNVESHVFVRTNATREFVNLLRLPGDLDGDGSSRLFGGDDPDDGDPRSAPWNLEIAGNGHDENGFEGDLPAEDAPPPGPPPAFTLPEPFERVVVVSVDALRRDMVGPGGRARTPALDALGRKSVRFARAFTPATYTSAAMWCYLRSRQPTALEAPGPTMPEVLRAARVDTAAVVNAYFADIGLRAAGFDRFIASIPGREPAPAPETTRLALSELARRTGPRLLWVHYFDPHEPYTDRARGTGRSAFERYVSEVEATDRAVGRLLAEVLDGRAPTTAVLFFADHGEEFREHGAQFHDVSVYSELVHVPLVLHVPGLAARTVRSPVRLIDVAPTVLDLLHVRVPAAFQGRSLLRLARDGQDPGFDHRAVAVNRTGSLAFIGPGGRWKLIVDRVQACVELYDLESDPGETRNLVDVRPDQVLRLRRLLEVWGAREGRGPRASR